MNRSIYMAILWGRVAMKVLGTCPHQQSWRAFTRLMSHFPFLPDPATEDCAMNDFVFFPNVAVPYTFMCLMNYFPCSFQPATAVEASPQPTRPRWRRPHRPRRPRAEASPAEDEEEGEDTMLLFKGMFQ